MKTKKKLAIFDFDGTLFDTYESLVIVYQKGFQKIGLPCTREECAIHMHHSLEQTIRARQIPEHLITPFVKEIIRALDDEDALKAIRQFPETLEAIRRTKKAGLTLAIVTGNSSEHVRNVLKMNQLNDDFETIIGSDICQESKPSPAPLLMALKKHPEITKEEAFYIGDSFQDVDAAKAVPMDSALIERVKDSYKDSSYSYYSNLLEALESLDIYA